MPTAHEQLRDALLRRQIYLLRYSGNLRNRIIKFLNDNEALLSDIIKSRLKGEQGLTTVAEYRKLKRVQSALTKARMQAWRVVEATLVDDLAELVGLEAAAAATAVAVALPVQVTPVLPPAGQLRAIVTARPFHGRLLRDHVKHLAREDLARIHGQIQLGMVAGEGSATIARRVRGTAELHGVDGITQMTRQQVQALTRTAVMHVSNSGRAAMFRENQDIISGEIFVATLDARTTPVCRANDGKRYKLGKGPQPPLHFGCRSLRVAVLDTDTLPERPANPTTEKQLLEEFTSEEGLAKVTKRGALPRGTKGKYDAFARRRKRELIGRVPVDTTYESWLRTQSTGFQEDVLGKTKAKLFRDGKLTLDKFVHRNGDELTLAELATKERQAFIDAGLNPDNY